LPAPAVTVVVVGLRGRRAAASKWRRAVKKADFELKKMGRLKPTDVPEEVITMLAESLGVDTDQALDCIMAIQDELWRRSP
jgi:hypothetical protein